MYISFRDVATLFPNNRGVNDPSLCFESLAISSKIQQPKGLFIPLTPESGELQEAIANGAIAALWDKQVTLPLYTPNQFPIFFTNDLRKGLERMMNMYDEKQVEQNKIQSNKTKFLFFSDSLLNNELGTYDIAEAKRELQQKRGGEEC